MQKYTSRVHENILVKNILVKYTEIRKTLKWYTSQVYELDVHTPFEVQVLHVTYLVFLRLQCFNPASSSFHGLQELGILFLSLLQGDFLSLNCTLSFFKLLGERRRKGGRRERERIMGRRERECQATRRAYPLVGVSLSKPHTSVTALLMRVSIYL